MMADTDKTLPTRNTTSDLLMCGLCYEMFPMNEYNDHMMDNHPDSLLADEDVSIVPSNDLESPFLAPLPIPLEVKPDVTNLISSETQPFSLKLECTEGITGEDHALAGKLVKVELIEDRKALDISCALLDGTSTQIADLKRMHDVTNWGESPFKINEVRSCQEDCLPKDGFEKSYGDQHSQMTEYTVSKHATQTSYCNDMSILQACVTSVDPSQINDKLPGTTADVRDSVHGPIQNQHPRNISQVIRQPQSVKAIPSRADQYGNQSLQNTYVYNQMPQRSPFDPHVRQAPYLNATPHMYNHLVHQKPAVPSPQEINSCMYGSPQQLQHNEYLVNRNQSQNSHNQFHQPTSTPLREHGNASQNLQGSTRQDYQLPHPSSTFPPGATPSLSVPTQNFQTIPLSHVPQNMFHSRNPSTSFSRQQYPLPIPIQPPMELTSTSSTWSQDASHAGPTRAGKTCSTRNDKPYSSTHHHSTQQLHYPIPPRATPSASLPNKLPTTRDPSNHGCHSTTLRTEDIKPFIQPQELYEDVFEFHEEPKIICDLCPPSAQGPHKFFNKFQILKHQREVHYTEANSGSEWCRGCGKKYIRGSGDARIKHEAKCNGFAMLPQPGTAKRQRLRK